MSYKQMKYYQELGDFEAAYKVARADWEADASLRWPRNSIAWLLIRMMKGNARAYGQRKFLLQLGELKRLGIPKTDKRLWGAAAWPIRDIVEDSLRMQWFTPAFGDALFLAIRELPFERPKDSYSALLKAFVALGGLWPRLAEFIDWWDFGNLLPMDFRRYPENGRLVSLAEKAMTEYLAALRREGEGRQPSIAFMDGLNRLASCSQEQAERIYEELKIEN